MGFGDLLKANVKRILNQEWTVRTGLVVPAPATVKLDGGAVKLKATMLYADLADSTELAMNYDFRTAAKVFKSFLSCASLIIKRQGGNIRSYDGDRVMGVFLGSNMEAKAVRAALQINGAFLHIIKPELETKYDKLNQGSYRLAHCVGIDTSEVWVIRCGVINDNDLTWVGRAPNIAAKLSALRESPYHSYITHAVYINLPDYLRYEGDNQHWERRPWDGAGDVKVVYRSGSYLPF
jgi:class 3 adenylate cyclase